MVPIVRRPRWPEPTARAASKPSCASSRASRARGGLCLRALAVRGPSGTRGARCIVHAGSRRFGFAGRGNPHCAGRFGNVVGRTRCRRAHPSHCRRTSVHGGDVARRLRSCRADFFLSPDVDGAKLGASLLLFGVGIGIFVTPNNTAILRSVGTERRGIANGVRSTLQNAGFVIGTALTLSIATAPLPPLAQRAAYGGSLGHLSDADLASFTQGCHWALGTLSACCALGVLLSLAIQRRNRAVR